MIELHRQRVDTVDDGIRLLDELLDLTERLTLDGKAFSLLDDMHATADVVLDEPDDVDFKAVVIQLHEGLAAFAKAHTDPECEDGFAFEYTLADMALRLKMLREWLNTAQLDHDARQAART
jgi:hypothetical protein